MSLSRIAHGRPPREVCDIVLCIVYCVLGIAYCMTKGTLLDAIRRMQYATCTVHRWWVISWLAVLLMLLVACGPTGPTPIKYTVPTADLSISTPAESLATAQLSPTVPESPTLTPAESALITPEPTSTEIVTHAGWNTFSLVPGGRILTPTAGRDTVLWSAIAGPGLGLYLHDLRTGKTQLISEPSVSGGCVCRGYRRGDWVVMVEAEPGAPWWEIRAFNLATEDVVFIGRTEDQAALEAPRPSEFGVNANGVVVWKDVVTEADGSVVEALRLHDVASGEAPEIVSVRSPVRIDQVTMYDNWVVWNQATEGEAGTRGDVFAYNVQADQLIPIGETGRAWEPVIWGKTVGWMHADGPFADGDVFLYDLEIGQGRLLTEDGQVSSVGVGDGFVAWSSVVQGIVVRRDLETSTNDIIGRASVSRLTAGGNTIAWLVDGDPETLHIAWRR